MRVIHIVCSENFAGVERYLTYTLPVLAARGVEVDLVGGPGSEMTGWLDGSDVRWHRGGNLREALRSLAPLRADIVHAHMTTAEAAAALAGPVVGGRLVTTRHFAQPRGSTKVVRAAGSVMARRFAAEVSISGFVADHVGVPSVVVLNGVPELPLGPHEDPTVLVAQRLEEEKQTQVALAAWSASGLADRGWTMTVAGRGSHAAALQQYVRDAGVEASVSFAGFDDHLTATMADAGILLATAPAEPFGLTVVEAMACGLPVVAAGGGAHVETAGAAVPESLFPPGDVGAAAERLVRLADDPQLRREEGQRLRDHQRAHLSIEAHVDGLLAVYDKVLRR